MTVALPDDRQGYFYISEGYTVDDTDDVLQLTVALQSSSSERIFGRAAAVFPDSTPNTATPPGPYYGPSNNNPASPPYWINQPESDDVLGTRNLVGSSTVAEVCYFLRAGILYRRVLLVRDLLNVSPKPTDGNPRDDSGVALNMGAYLAGGTSNFWTDFDYSAWFDGSTLQFHSVNTIPSSFDLGANISPFSQALPKVLGNPAYRFGFNSSLGTNFGLPREYITSGGNLYFIGRFTQRETSDPNFGYPGQVTGGVPNPMDPGTTLTYDVVNGVVTNYQNGPRAGEDVLMSNVLAFDIKVWDPAASLGPDGLPGIAGVNDDGINGVDDSGEVGAYNSDDGDWRDIGHPGLTLGAGTYGFYRAGASLNTNYSNPNPASTTPPTPPTNRYDTWNPNLDLNGDGVLDLPPYRPIYAGPDGKPGKANFDDDGDTITDNASELGWPGTDDFAPLTAIKITIRFYDVTTNQVRDVSGVYRLVFEP
jgi:hypothetical protein